jgi:hypothetical protein
VLVFMGVVYLGVVDCGVSISGWNVMPFFGYRRFGPILCGLAG